MHLPAWATKPDIVVNLICASITLVGAIITLVGAFATMYPELARAIVEILTVPLNKMPAAWRYYRLEYYRKELEMYKRLHNNAYELVLHVIVRACKLTIFSAIIVIVESVLLLLALKNGIDVFFTHALRASLSANAIVCGATVVLVVCLAMIGWGILDEFINLQNYAKHVSFLEAKIAKLSSPR